MATRVNIITGDVLLAAGIKHLLRNLFGIDATAMTVPPESGAAEQSCELTITDCNSFATNASYFVPRRNRVLLITDGETPADQGIATLNRRDTEDAIIERLADVVRRSCATADDSNQLSQREIEVLRFVAQGLLNKEIADRLNISINTVLSHRKNITAKLGIKSASALSVYAIINGYI